MAKEKTPVLVEAPSTANLINHVEIEVEAILGTTALTVAELNALADGDVIKLDAQINDPVSIRVNGRTIGRGKIVTVNDRFAVRITEIGS